MIEGKKFFHFLVVTAFILLCCRPLYSTVYYVSATGNDGNSGTSTSTPWKSIAKVNTSMNTFLPGDKILFNKGDVFEGEIKVTKSGTSGNEITFDSYGAGLNPKITGFKKITGWTIYSGNIYEVNVNDTISNLYVNGTLMTIARFPDSGWLRVDSPNGTNGFSDAALTQGAGYWNGANCRIRTTNWCYETIIVSSFSSANITFSSPSQYAINSDYGYYLDNKLNLLTTENEWYYDKSTHKIYLYAPGGINPNSMTIDGAAHIDGFVITASNILIQNLTIEGYKEEGIEVPNSNNVSIKNCSINKNDKTGITIYGNNHLIENNVLQDNLNTGIVSNIFNGNILNNNINRTGLIPGYGKNSWGYIGVIMGQYGTVFKNNIIDSSGYSGISTIGNNRVENNYVDYSCLILNDGAAIGFDMADGLQIINNVFSNTISDKSSCPIGAYTLAYGIYFGNRDLKNILVSGNTIASNRSVGMYVDNSITSDNFQILNNTFYNNFTSQILLSNYSSTSFKPVFNNIIRGNIFYSLNSEQSSMVQKMYYYPTFSDFGTFDSNYYCNPYNELVIKRTILSPQYSSIDYKLSKWKNDFNEDLHSKVSNYAFDQFKVTDTIGTNFITNSRFATNISSWATWPSGSTISHVINNSLDTGSMKIQWNGTGFTENFCISNSYPIIQGNYYLMSLSCIGNNSGLFKIWVRPSLAGIYDIGLNRIFGYENFRKNHSYIFRADTTDLSTTFSVGMSLPDSILYVDNASIYQVSVERVDSTSLSKLFTNTTDVLQNIPLNGIPYKDLNNNIVSSLSLPPYSSKILINENAAAFKQLQLKAIIESFYNSNSNLMTGDSVIVFLRNAVSPFSKVDSAKSILNNSGTGTFNFSNASNGVNYYLALRHRNALETWSGTTVTFSSGLLNYDFSTGANKAYGNNLVLVDNSPITYAIYSGDQNQSGTINLNDIINVSNDGNNFITGYVPSDINGDAIVNLNDVIVSFNNSIKFINKITP
ncbi:MAG: right-handed parallel beta-helix repeat-containing protein [Ignavibacteria bacterium]